MRRFLFAAACWAAIGLVGARADVSYRYLNDQAKPNEQKPLPAGAVWRVGSGHVGQVAGLGLLDNVKTLLTSAKDDSLRLWDFESGKTVGQIVEPHSRPKSIAVRADGKVLALLAPDGTLKLLELPSGKPVKSWQAETVKNMGSIAFSPNGKQLVSSGLSTTLWDAATGKPLQRFKHPPEANGALSFSPDGKILCTASAKGLIRLWDVATGKELGQLAGHTDYVDVTAFSADGKVLASVSHDNTTRLWDLENQQEIRLFKVTYGVALAFSRDGRSLAAGGSDGIIHVWETASGKERASFDSKHGCVMVLLFSPNAKALISGHVETAALCWDVSGRGRGQPRNNALSAEEFAKEWQHLGGDDAQLAFRALWTLAATAKQSVARAQKELQPAKAIDDKMIARFIVDLDADNFAVREKAAADLKKAGDRAWPALREALAKDSPLETKTRARQLLALQFEPDADRLRVIRSLELLEHIRDADARALLRTLSKGAAGAWITEEATRILQRIEAND